MKLLNWAPIFGAMLVMGAGAGRRCQGHAQQPAAPAKPAPAAAAASPSWKSLFDGAALGGWKRTEFGGGGLVRVEKRFRGGPPAIVVESGAMLSGITWTRDTPKTDYEISLEMMKIEGMDFPCGLTFPVGASHASLILGGWGGGVVGISSVDGQDASENETTQRFAFPKEKWFRVRLAVTAKKIEAWLDDRKVVDLETTNRRISLRHGEISMSIPLGLATFQTSAAYRNIRIRPLPAR